jgi:hypothetical protein
MCTINGPLDAKGQHKFFKPAYITISILFLDGQVIRFLKTTLNDLPQNKWNNQLTHDK